MKFCRGTLASIPRAKLPSSDQSVNGNLIGKSPGVYEINDSNRSSPEPMNKIPVTSFGHREWSAPLRFDLFLDLGIKFYSLAAKITLLLAQIPPFYQRKQD